MESQCALPQLRSLLLDLQTPQVRQAEQRLRSLTIHPSFFAQMFNIMTSGSQLQWIKTMAASFVSSVFCDNVNEENCDSLFEAVEKVLMDPNIKSMDKRCFEKSIIKIMEQGTTENKQKWINMVHNCLLSPIHFDPAYLVIACLACADIPLDLLYTVLSQNYEKIVSSVPVNIDNSNLLNEMFKMWIVVVDKLKLNEQENSKDAIRTIVANKGLMSIIQGIYLMEAGAGGVTCLQEGLQQLNLLKYQAAEMHKRMLEYIDAQLQDATDLIILQFTKHTLPKQAATLMSLSSNRSEIQNLGAQDLITTLLSILRLYLNHRPSQFREVVYSIINRIVFPLMAVDDNQRQTFQETPEEFNSLTQDCCDKQTYGTMKTQAAKLLEKVGDKIEGAIEYVVRRVIESLKFKLGFVQTHAFQDLNPLQIETALLAISIFSYNLASFPSQVSTLSQIISDERCKSLPPLQLSRVFTFLAYNYLQIYPQLSAGQPWLHFILSYTAHPTTQFCALDCFSNVIEDYFNQTLLEKLVNQIAIGKLGLIWEIIEKVIQHHFNIISGAGFGIIIDKLFIRINKQMQSLDNQQKKDTLDLINSIRVLSSIMKQLKTQCKGEVNAVKRQYIMSKVWPVLDLYQIVKKYDVEDQVVKLATLIVNNMEGTVGEITKPHLFNYLEAYKATLYSEKVYIRFFNQFLLKADFNKNMHQIILILIALKDGLFHILGKLTDKEGKLKNLPHLRINISNLMLIVQNAIAVFGTYLISSHNLDFFHEISSFCARLLPRQASQVQKTAAGRILQVRAFNLLFLCHMHLKVQSIFDYLHLLESQKVYRGYDTVVLTMCINKQIFNETDITAIIKLVQGLGRIAELSEEKNQKIEKQQRQENKKTKITSTLKTFEDYDKLLKSMDTPFQKSETVPELLTSMFQEMKRSNPELFHQIMQVLPGEDMSRYHNLVDFAQLDKKPRKIVKVVGVKVGNEPQTIEWKESNSMQEDSDAEESNLKRQRMKVKAELKGKKMVKGDRKKLHAEQQ